MNTFFSMQVFKEVVELGSFIRAAEKLGLSPAMTSKHIQQLEAHLGVRLLHRTSRRVSLTDEGRTYYARGSHILEDLAELEAELNSASAKPQGLLRLAAPAWLHNTVFATALSNFRSLYPEVQFDLLLSDRLVDLIEEGIDIALRVTPEPHATLYARRICEVPLIFAASPDYLERKGRPQNLEDFAQHDMLMHSSVKDELLQGYMGDTELHQVRVQAVLTTNDTDLLARTAMMGMGIAIIPKPVLEDSLLAGGLEIVLPEFKPPMAYYLYAVYSSRRHQSPKVRRFIDFMVETFGPCPSSVIN